MELIQAATHDQDAEACSRRGGSFPTVLDLLACLLGIHRYLRFGLCRVSVLFLEFENAFWLVTRRVRAFRASAVLHKWGVEGADGGGGLIRFDFNFSPWNLN